MFKEAILINGKKYAQEILDVLKKDILHCKKSHNLVAKLGIILVGSNPASNVYVRNKINAAKKVGVETKYCHFNEDITEQKLLDQIKQLNEDKSISGIIVQMPLPEHISVKKIINQIAPEKDVDGFHPVNIGLLYSGYGGGFIPCTARGVLKLIKTTIDNLAGKKVVVIGRSNIIGRPVSALLLQENATVTLCHSKTKDLKSITLSADIVISAVGRSKFLTSEYFNNHALVIDVGINRIAYNDKYTLSGDVDFDSVKNKVSYITPVPGGVGPMTIAYLLTNTFEAALKQNAKRNS